MKLLIRSRHPSHDVLRNKIRTRVRTVFRLGSFTDVPTAQREINTVEACMNSANKKEMKRLFIEHGVKTAIYCDPQNEDQLVNWIRQNDLVNNQLIIKSYRGSRGRGLYLVNGLEEAVNWFNNNNRPKYGGYIIEKYYNYNREYRLHVAADGCFYTCRKMLKSDATTRWYRNDSNSVWITEDNVLFDKPSNWDNIVEHCIKALNAVGLDIGACDVRVQSASVETPKFIICEINSAPSFGEITAEKYKTKLEQICAI